MPSWEQISSPKKDLMLQMSKTGKRIGRGGGGEDLEICPWAVEKKVNSA